MSLILRRTYKLQNSRYAVAKEGHDEDPNKKIYSKFYETITVGSEKGIGHHIIVINISILVQ